MGEWDFNQTLPVHPSPALYYTEPNCCIVSGLHLSLPEVMLTREIIAISASAHQPVISSLPALLWALIWSEVLTQSSQRRDTEHLLTLLTLGIQRLLSPLGIIQQLARSKRRNTDCNIFLCYTSAKSCT